MRHRFLRNIVCFIAMLSTGESSVHAQSNFSEQSQIYTSPFEQYAENHHEESQEAHAYADYNQALGNSDSVSAGTLPLENSTRSESGHTYRFGPVQLQIQNTGYGTEVPLTDTPLPKTEIIEESFYGLVFKPFYSEFSWLFGSGDHLGITTLKASQPISFANLPLLTLTPEFGTIFFNGPGKTDLPGEVFSSSLMVSWFQPVSKEWQFLFSVTPGYYSDFKSSQDALRISGMGLAFYKWNDEWTLSMGVVYLARDDVRLLPAAGLTWQPDPDHKLEMTFPKPKYSWRTSQDDHVSRWGYLAGEFGGGTWAVRRVDGTDDLLTIRDYRILFGWESREDKTLADFFELGYVFSRKVDYKSDIGDFSPGSGFMLRMGWSY